MLAASANWSSHATALVVAAMVLLATHADAQDATAAPVESTAWDDVTSLKWLDPPGAEWQPIRGARFELGANLGGEGALTTVQQAALPTLGGVSFHAMGRYYPVDHLAATIGVRSYFGLDGVPATGTTAATVSSLLFGFRYDLVRENRFSLMFDFYSGPALYVFSPIERLVDFSFIGADNAVGAEMGAGLSMRYSIGPWTGEMRGVAGGRAGATSTPFQRAGDAGLFSALYLGLDGGFTWSIQ